MQTVGKAYGRGAEFAEIPVAYQGISCSKSKSRMMLVRILQPLPNVPLRGEIWTGVASLLNNMTPPN